MPSVATPSTPQRPFFILLTVKQIARQRKTTAGNVVSGLLRESLQPKSFTIDYRGGVPVLPLQPNAPVVTTELVNRLLNEDEGSRNPVSSIPTS